jgi:hypothetical protein
MAAAIAIFVSLFSSFGTFFLLLPMMTPNKREQDKARARRMAEHKMNARLLRLNL